MKLTLEFITDYIDNKILENEEILNYIVEKYNLEIVPIDENLFSDVPLLPVNIKGTICICPTELYEGFFVSKIRKK